MATWNIVKYTLIEAIRNKIYFISFIFALVLLFLARALAALSFSEQGVMFFDFSLAGLNLIGVFLAIFLGVFLLQKECEPKALLLVLSKPISHTQYLCGKFIGYYISIFFVLLLTAAILMLIFVLYDVSINAHFFAAFAGILLDVFVCLSFVFFFSQITKLFLAMAFSFCFWLICHAHNGLKYLLENSSETSLKVVNFVVNTVAPNFSTWNFKDLYYLEKLVIADYLYAGIYAFAWGAFYFLCAILIFRKKDCV